MVQPKRCIMAFLLALSLLLSAAGCASASAADQEQTKVKASAQAPAGNNQELADYLKAARNDLNIVDDIMADKDIGLLEESSDSDEEFSTDMLSKYNTILKDYTDRIDTVLSDIDGRATPKLPDLVYFQTAEKSSFQTLKSILQEYTQTLSYAGTILEVSDKLNELENVKGKDLKAIYNAYKTCLTDAIKLLQTASVPSFVESFNKDFIDGLKQTNDAVLYALNAVALDDPLRSDAAGYLTGVLVRRLDHISQEWSQNLSERQDSLKKDSLAVQRKCDGLKKWLDTNLAKLGG